MTYRVKLQKLAEQDLEEAYLWAARQAPDTAARWYNRLQAAIGTLTELPHRYAVAPENRKVKYELRQMLFGKRPNVYRVLFVIDDDMVRVLRIRHASRRLLRKADLTLDE